MKTVIGLCLEPLDPLFFRDGRPFTGAERSVSTLPLPQTVAGGIRTALLRAAGCDFQRLGAAVKNGESFAEAVKKSCAPEHAWIGGLAVRGPWLARQDRCGENGGGLEVLVPVPATLHREKRDGGKLHRLLPLPDGQLPGWYPPADRSALRPLWLKRLPPTEPAAGYLTRRGLERFLRGATVAADDVVPRERLFDLDYRTGIGIAPDRLVAERSQIFGRGFLSLRQDVFLYLEVELPHGAPPPACLSRVTAIPLGGEGRHVMVRALDRPFSWPDTGAEGGGRKPLVLLTTPCSFEAGWKPRGLEGYLVSAAVPGSIAFSGWDLARGGPKPTRFAVPAGSVYFLNSMPPRWSENLAESEEDRQQGWGCCLKGVWNDE